MNTDLIYYLAVFAVVSAIIIGAGVLLAKSGDRIADVTGLGGLLIGMVLVAAATSLPEIAVAVSAVVTEDAPDLAIGNLFGSNMANMALLAVVDLLWRGKVWQHVGAGHARTAAVGISLTAIAVLAVLQPFGAAIGWVGIESIIIFIGFISLIAWTHRSSTPAVPTGEVSHEQVTAEDAAHQHLSGADVAGRGAILHTIRWDLAKFGVAAIVILLSAPILVDAADGIAREAELGESFVGASFLAFSTSLPELATAIAAVRIGAFDLAVGSLLGSNAFNMAIIFFVDLFYTEGPILAGVHPIEAFVGVSAILLMSIVVAGIIHGTKTKAWKLEPGSGMTIVVYFILMYMIFNSGA